ncbi:MAG: FG-GAP repeat protein [Candidatus Omnitrophica bacterium]|nr:FG-GAP repeat protein [Candidatus Omnitrophota bacterium]
MKRLYFFLFVCMIAASSLWSFAQSEQFIQDVSPVIQILGRTHDELGSSFLDSQSGDFNGDGRQELILYAAREDKRGELLIFNGEKDIPGTFDLEMDDPDLFIEGNAPNREFGYGWITGDFNNDGIDDLAAWELVLTLEEFGSAYVFLGGHDFFERGRISARDADHIFQGTSHDYQTRTSLVLGDFNGDGKSDLVIGNDSAKGRFQNMGSAGAAYLFWGRDEWAPIIEIKKENVDAVIYGKDDDMPVTLLARSAAAGDMNGDGIDDIAVFAWWGGIEQAGEGYVLYGKSEWPAVIELDEIEADLTIQSPFPHGGLGHSIAFGDVNQDGFDDLLCSAWVADSLGRENNGAAFIVFGGRDLPASIMLTRDAGAVVIHGRSDLHHFGYLARVGDFNADGIDDALFTGVWPDAVEEGENDHSHAALFYGREEWPAVIDLDKGGYDFLLRGGEENRFIGVSAYFMRWNDDAADDLILGDMSAIAPGRDKAGIVYILNGIAPAACLLHDYE